MDGEHHPQGHQQPLQLHIPSFVFSSVPTLVPGGGAEVIPLANQEWFINNGFTPTLAEYPFSASHPQDEQQQQHRSDAAPFDYSSLPANPPVPFPTHSPPPDKIPDLSLFLAGPPRRLPPPPPSTFGLPVYSASGFDLIDLLARIAKRPSPRIALGPVDLSCSFVVVDVRRYDHPIVYCSSTFCTLTGYQEEEVLGQNCRFLQAPGGVVARGEVRQHTSQDAVAHIRKSLMADKECQTTILNYKKNGDAFYNLVTIIPVPGGLTGEENEVIYQVGFQVSLNDQPNAILEKHKEGSYVVNYASQGRPQNRIIQHQSILNGRDRKSINVPPVVMSKELKRILGSSSFLRSFPIPTPGPTPSTNATSAEDAVVAGGNNHLLHLFLLEANPDFYHVVSLKGDFLYVAPSVRRVLGYESEEMMGTSISDYAHPEDVVPLMRELKESSAMGVTFASAVGTSASAASSGGEASAAAASPSGPRPVDLLFRAKTKMGRYVWVQCRGRLHVEPGKGRKAIVLIGRAREMMNLKWEDVNEAGGMAKTLCVRRPPQTVPQSQRSKEKKPQPQPMWVHVEQQAWGMLGGADQENATFMSISQGMQDVLGWTSDDLMGTNLLDIVEDEGARNVIAGFIHAMRTYQRHRHLLRRPSGSTMRLDDARWKKVQCRFRNKNGGLVDVWFVLYRADPDRSGDEEVPVDESWGVGMAISPAHLVYQIRLVEAETVQCGSSSAVFPLTSGSSPATSTTTATASSSSSLTNALSTLSSSSAASSPRHPQSSSASSTTSDSTWPSTDMFEELAIERGSSWQYEREQLRIANSKLMEEIAAFEATVVEADAEMGDDHSQALQLSDEELPTTQPSSPLPLQHDDSDLYEYSSSFGDGLRSHAHQQQQPPRPLFSMQRLMSQQPCPPLLLPPPPQHQLIDSLSLPPPLSLPPYLHQPQPQLALQNVTQELQVGASSMGVTPNDTQEQHQQQRRTVFASLSLPPESERYEKDWSTMAPLPPPLPSSGLPPPLSGAYARRNYAMSGSSSSLKRSWNAMDS